MGTDLYYVSIFGGGGWFKVLILMLTNLTFCQCGGVVVVELRGNSYFCLLR